MVDNETNVTVATFDKDKDMKKKLIVEVVKKTMPGV